MHALHRLWSGCIPGRGFQVERRCGSCEAVWRLAAGGTVGRAGSTRALLRDWFASGAKGNIAVSGEWRSRAQMRETRPFAELFLAESAEVISRLDRASIEKAAELLAETRIAGGRLF